MDIPPIQRIISVLWPSFLLAGIATVVFFTAFDPTQVAQCLGPHNITRVGTYSVGFFLFWLMNIASSILTLYFQRPCHQPVERPLRDLEI